MNSLLGSLLIGNMVLLAFLLVKVLDLTDY
jgi:hypothetical protein